MTNVLTRSEQAVLELLADGHTCREAAERRHASYFTVDAQRKMIREKLHARNMAHAVAIAFRRGLLQ